MFTVFQNNASETSSEKENGGRANGQSKHGGVAGSHFQRKKNQGGTVWNGKRGNATSEVNAALILDAARERHASPEQKDCTQTVLLQNARPLRTRRTPCRTGSVFPSEGGVPSTKRSLVLLELRPFSCRRPSLGE